MLRFFNYRNIIQFPICRIEFFFFLIETFIFQILSAKNSKNSGVRCKTLKILTLTVTLRCILCFVHPSNRNIKFLFSKNPQPEKRFTLIETGKVFDRFFFTAKHQCTPKWIGIKIKSCLKTSIFLVQRFSAAWPPWQSFG